MEVKTLDESQEKEIDQSVQEKEEVEEQDVLENEDLQNEIEQKGDEEEQYVESSTINH